MSCSVVARGGVAGSHPNFHPAEITSVRWVCCAERHFLCCLGRLKVLLRTFGLDCSNKHLEALCENIEVSFESIIGSQVDVPLKIIVCISFTGAGVTWMLSSRTV